jgi:hypothetical protein
MKGEGQFPFLPTISKFHVLLESNVPLQKIEANLLFIKRISNRESKNKNEI